jgi:cold shock CspA family protein/ribosome-associated translation inhibitor RaiA
MDTLQVSFHNLPHSDPVETAIHDAVARLAGFCDRIIGCCVVIDQPHRHHRQGNPVRVKIELKVPGSELVVKREPAADLTDGDLIGVIHEAFEDLQRQLEQFVSRRRRFVKNHERTPHARVAKVFPEAGYGFLETLDGRELFFHRNSVLNRGFDHLSVGAEVAYVEELGDKGPQASTVKPVGRHNHEYAP